METANLTEGKRAKNRPKWPSVREVSHKNGARAWLVDARKKGQGERHFFKTRTEADTRAF